MSRGPTFRFTKPMLVDIMRNLYRSKDEAHYLKQYNIPNIGTLRQAVQILRKKYGAKIPKSGKDTVYLEAVTELKMSNPELFEEMKSQ